MNEAQSKALLKIIKSVIPPEAIREGAIALVNSLIDFKNETQLNPDKGEVITTGIIYEINNIVYCGLAILNAENKIVRFEKIRPLNELIDELIKKM